MLTTSKKIPKFVIINFKINKHEKSFIFNRSFISIRFC